MKILRTHPCGSQGEKMKKDKTCVRNICYDKSLARIEERQKGDERIVRPRPPKALWRFMKRAARFTLVPANCLADTMADNINC